MKKYLLIIAGLTFPALINAQTSEPQIIDAMYALKMSPSGQWIANSAGDATVYEYATGKSTVYYGGYFGLGNTIANTGMAVGSSSEDQPMVLFNGNAIYPESLSSFSFCDLNGITPDGSRLVGFGTNPDKNGVMMVPFVADVDAEGNVSDPVMMPYPTEDFFGVPPQYVTAVWVSDDGTTVAGVVTDNIGYYSYPIIFTEDEAGEWSYSLPSEPLFNPNHLVLPESPYKDEPEFPSPENFMFGTNKTAYQEAYANWVNGNGSAPYPEDYMTEEEYAEYEKAVDLYNEWFDKASTQFVEYFRIYNQIMEESPTFVNNDLALAPSGDVLLMHGGMIDKDGELLGKIYRFNLTEETSEVLDPPTPDCYPSLMLSDGTIFLATPKTDVPTSYIMAPGAESFVTVPEYFQTSHPEISSWVNETIPFGSGAVSMNEDKTLLIGALMPTQYADYDEDAETNVFYTTYFFGLGANGVKTIEVEPTDGIYRVFNLQGVKVLETRDATQISSLSKGIYIINGKKIIL